jgi:hypothetical protein
MTDAAEQASYPVVMEVADWTIIDGTMDNEIQGIRDEGWREDGMDPAWAELEQLGESIRQAGWDQLPDWPDNYEALQNWPEPGRTEAMRLSARQWGLVVTALEGHAETYDEIDEPEVAATSRRIAALVRERLAERGLNPVPVMQPRFD